MSQSKKLLKNDSQDYSKSYLKTKPKKTKPLVIPISEQIQLNLDTKLKHLQDSSPKLHPFKPKLVADPSLKTL